MSSDPAGAEPGDTSAPPRELRPAPLPLRLFYLTYFGALGVYLPLFPAWLEARGLRGATLGLVYSSLPAMGVIAPPLFGIAADRFGAERSLLVVLTTGTVLSFALMAGLGATSLLAPGLLVSLVVFFALARAPIMSLADATTLDLLGPGRYSRMRVFGSLGFALGALLVAPQLDVASPTELPVATAAAHLAALLVAFRMPRASRPPQKGALAGAAALLRTPALLALFGATLLGQLAHSAYDLCFSLHVRDQLGPSAAGPAWAIGVVAEIAVMASGPRIFGRFGAAGPLALGFACAAARFALLAWVRHPVAILALQPLHALSFALPWISAVARARELSGGALVATGQSLILASYAAGATLGMPLWSRLYAERGAQMFWFPVPFALAASMLVLATRRRRAREAERP